MKHTKTSEDVKSKLLEAALDYAGRGLHVFPVHTPAMEINAVAAPQIVTTLGSIPARKTD